MLRVITCSKNQILFLIFINLSSFSSLMAKVILNSPTYLEEEERQCLLEFLPHPLFKQTIGHFHPTQLNLEQKMALQGLDQYCRCSVELRQKELRLKRDNQFAWFFIDTEQRLDKEDQCALRYLNDQMLNLVFSIIVTGRIRNSLISRLESRSPASVPLMASENSYMAHLGCLQDKILGQCVRTRSLRSTFICIRSLSSDEENFQLLNRACPSPILKDEQMNKIRAFKTI